MTIKKSKRLFVIGKPIPTDSVREISVPRYPNGKVQP